MLLPSFTTHSAALAPAFSMPVPVPTAGSWLAFRSHSLDTSLSAATHAAAAAGAAGAVAGNAATAAGASAVMHNSAGCQAAAASPATACHSPLPAAPPGMAPDLGGGGLGLERCCSLDGDLELEAMHSLMSDSQPSG